MIKRSITGLSDTLTDRQMADIAAAVDRKLANVRLIRRDNTTYAQRIALQLDLWHRGIVAHNDIDNECVPDFSCCGPCTTNAAGVTTYLRLAPQRLRELFCRDPRSRQMLIGEWLAVLSPVERSTYDLAGQTVLELRPGTRH